MDMAKKIGERLRTARNESGLTQSEVAEALDTHTVTISRWERGEWLPNIQNQEKLCQLYGKRHEELFPELDEQDEEQQVSQEEGRRNDITVEIHIPANLREAQTITITVTPPVQSDDQEHDHLPKAQARHLHIDPAPYLALMREETKDTKNAGR